MNNREEVAQLIEIEGLSYFLTDYASADCMPDDELKKAFQKASDAISEFEALLPDVT